MKKIAILIVCMLALTLFCGCEPKEQSDMKPAKNEKITVINELTEADVWILPDTKENKKTTVWGKATASKVKTGESRETPLCEAGDDERYLLRMIDTDSFYYSADGIALEADWTIKITEDDTRAVTAEVTDKNGDIKNTYEVFSARL